MQVKLAYGREGLSINVPDAAHVITPRFVPGLADEAQAIRAALRHPIASAPLAAKVKPGDKVVIAHSDITRATPNERLLPVLAVRTRGGGHCAAGHHAAERARHASTTNRIRAARHVGGWGGGHLSLPAARCLRRCESCFAGRHVARASGARQPAFHGSRRPHPDRLHRAALLCRVQRRAQGRAAGARRRRKRADESRRAR